MGPVDVSAVVAPWNPGQVSDAPATVVAGAVVGAVVVLLDDPSDPPPEQLASPSVATASSTRATTEDRARDEGIGAEASEDGPARPLAYADAP